MSSRVHCNQCGASNFVETALDWVEIDSVGLNTWTLGLDPFAHGPMHLCSACWKTHLKTIEETA